MHTLKCYPIEDITIGTFLKLYWIYRSMYKLKIFILKYFIYFHSSRFLPSPPLNHSYSSHSYSPWPLWGCSHHYHGASLNPQVSWGLSTASTEARPGRALLHMCQGPQTSLCMLLVGDSVSGSSLGSGLVKIAGLPMGLLSLSAS